MFPASSHSAEFAMTSYMLLFVLLTKQKRYLKMHIVSHYVVLNTVSGSLFLFLNIKSEQSTVYTTHVHLLWEICFNVLFKRSMFSDRPDIILKRRVHGRPGCML